MSGLGLRPLYLGALLYLEVECSPWLGLECRAAHHMLVFCPCNTLRERWAESGPRSRLRIRLLTPEEMAREKPRRRKRRRG